MPEQIDIYIPDTVLSESTLYDISLGQKLCYPIIALGNYEKSSDEFFFIKKKHRFDYGEIYTLSGKIKAIIDNDFFTGGTGKSGVFQVNNLHFLLLDFDESFLKTGNYISGDFKLILNPSIIPNKTYDPRKKEYIVQKSMVKNLFHIWHVKQIQLYKANYESQIFEPNEYIEKLEVASGELESCVINLELIEEKGIEYLNKIKADPNDIEQYNFL